MRKETIPGRNGYDIPCISQISGHENLAVIISHGFGSSKESPSAQAISAALPEYGIGAFRFDFPAHGESPADGEALRIENCLSDLAAVEAHVRTLLPEAEIAYFSSSFGAYINLIYLSAKEHAGHRSFLRCAAVDMPGIMRRGTTPDHRALLDKQGFVMLDDGYVRPLKITRGFLEDLDAYDVFKLYHPGATKLAMIHGTADETAPLEDARRFAKLSGAMLTEVEGADHRFLIPGGMERVVHTAIQFFTSPVGR